MKKGVNHMDNLIIVTNRPKFLNKDLESATLALCKCDMQIKARQFDIAAILADVDARKLYVDDGFASTQEYAHSTFGMQKSLAYALIDVGRNYTRPIISANGKTIGHCSNLLPPADQSKQDAPLIDFTTGQLSRISSLGREVIRGLIESGELTPQMTYKQLDALVKAYKPPKDTIEAETVEETETVETVEATETPDTGLKRDAKWDNVSDDLLIAELRKRCYVVYNSDGQEQVIDWN